jgi:hypothetical protein
LVTVVLKVVPEGVKGIDPVTVTGEPEVGVRVIV